jgi:prolyl oligopeptidase
MRKGVLLGIVSPRVTIEKVVPQIRTHIIDDPAQSEFYKPVQKTETLSEADRQTVTQEIVQAIRSDVVPAYRKLLQFVESEYLPACRPTVGIGAVPTGDKMYDELAYLNATVKVNADEVHQLGLSEVARIRGEMAKVQKEVGFQGSLDDFLTHMRTDPVQRFKTGEELYAAADAILQRSKPLMSKLFARIPKADCVMKELESFRAPASPVGYYNPSPEDGSRPGYYYINTYSPQERLRFTLEALSYHEAIPGHHFQMALHQENNELPKFRRYGSFPAYVEGWALYSEKLGYEIGGYKDAYSRFGQLTFEMWRACRLVVDTGMHAKGWSRQQAIDFMAGNTSLARLDIESEIDRYISWPGQALAYKIGELRILQLRREAEEKLGKKFDLRAFHDALLADGAMPIDVLETRIRTWITERQ